MYKIIREADATIRHIADNKIASNFITKDINPDLSFATTEATDYYEKETTPYNRIYYVLDGLLIITIDDEKFELNSGDTAYLGENTTYQMQGTFKAVVVNQPAFGS